MSIKQRSLNNSGGRSDTGGEGQFEQLKELLDENLELTKELEERVKKIHNYVKAQRVFFIFKLLLIIVPVTLGIIYLPPLLDNFISPYKELLGDVKSINDTAENLGNLEFQGNLDINSILNEFSR